MSIEFDASEVRRLAADLGKVPGRAVDDIAKAVEKGAVNIKKDWAQRWSGIAHAPSLPAAITYDRSFGLGSIQAEIGPDKDKRQGALGNIIEFGTVKNAPIPGGAPAMDAEEPRFAKALEDAAAKPLEDL